MSSKRREATVRVHPATGLPGVEFDAGAHLLLPSKVLRKLPDRQRSRLVDGARVRLDIVDHAGSIEIRRVEIIRDAPRDAAKHSRPRGARVEPRVAAVPDRDLAARVLAAEQQGLAWVNPYTFLPFVARPPADRFARPRSRTAPWPAGGELVSGRFTVTLQIASPLAIYGGHETVAPTHETRSKDGAWEPQPLTSEEQERHKADPKNAHRQVALLRDERGLPTIPGATLKGAMRSWLEAITSSPRPFSRLPVTWRAVSLAERLPGRLRLTLGGRPVEDLSKRSEAELKRVEAKILPMRLWPAPGEKGEERDKALASEWNLPERLRDGATVRSGPQVGYLKVSAGIGRDPSASVQVFLDDLGVAPLRLSGETLRDWLAAHRHGGSPTGGRSVRWVGRQWPLDRLDPRKMGDGALVWYTLDQDRQVAYLGRIKSGRWAHRRPAEVPGRVPAAHRGRGDGALAPADRIYGTAGSGGPEDAWAGRVRVSSARWAAAGEPATEMITLVPLSSPKVSSAGLYLTDPKARPVAWNQQGGQLAGTKVYWHTPPIGSDAGTATRVRRLGTADEPIKTSQNATVEAVVNGALRFEVRFEDLDARELGALLLACSLRLTGGQPARAGWKLGMGKPVGMGSVTNAVSDLRIYDLQRRYADPVGPDAGLEPAVAGEYERIALAYFLREQRDRDVLAGIADLDAMRDAPVAYPEPGALGRKPGREGARWDPQPSAEQVLFGPQTLALTKRASSRREQGGWPGCDPRPV